MFSCSPAQARIPRDEGKYQEASLNLKRRYLVKKYTMPACLLLSLLADTVDIPTGIIMMHANNSILFVYNDIMSGGSSNLHVVTVSVLIS